MSHRPECYPSPSQLVISSCCGAFITSFAVTPLDVVKIRMQAQARPSQFSRGHHFFYCNGLMDHLCVCLNGKKNVPWYRKPGHFRGTIDAFSKIIRNEGVLSLWSGLSPTLAMAIPATVIYFISYDNLKYLMGYDERRPGTAYRASLAACIARSLAATVISPLELMRTKLQAQQMSYSALRQTIATSIQLEGISALWRGLGPTLLRDIPFSALYWLVYETLKSRYFLPAVHTKSNRNYTDAVLPFSLSFSCGAAAGAVAGIVTLPFDVVKTHRQIEMVEGKTTASRSTFVLLARLYRQHGVSSLFVGVVPRLVKIVPACAIMISSFEFGKSYFQSRNKRAGLC